MIDQIDQALADMKVIEETIEKLRKANATLRFENEQLRKALNETQADLSNALQQIRQWDTNPYE